MNVAINSPIQSQCSVFGKIASAITGHLDYGDDCPLYRAIGYVPTSEQRRGRPRKVIE